MFGRSPEWVDWTSLEKLGDEAHGMPSSTVTSHHVKWEATLLDCWNVPKHAAATVLHANLKMQMG